MKIYAFGDSFTNCYNDSAAKWVSDYVNWKGYTPKSYIDLISEHYNVENINFAKQGNDNYSIIESFLENYKRFEKGDIIIINWSHIERFRVLDKNKNWSSVVPNVFENEIKNGKHDLSKETLGEILVNRVSQKYADELNLWINFIDFVFKDLKIVQWTVPTTYFIDVYNLPQYETITSETKNEIMNGHYSEKGNLDLSKDIIKIIEGTYTRRKNYKKTLL
jgi:hypothetical protein